MKENDTIPQITIGVDLGDKSHHICVLDQAGKSLEEIKIPNHREALTELAEKYPGARVGMEVGTHSPWVSHHLTAQGCETIVANARKLRVIYENDRKCDEFDARMIARITRFDPELLSPLKHISGEALADRMALGCRDRLVDHRKSLIQSVRSSVKSLGLRIDSCGAPVFAKTVRANLSDEARLLEMVEPMLEAIEKMTEGIRKLDREIEKLAAEKYKICETFRQVHGVGPLTSLAFTLAIEDPDRIEKTRDVGAYLGMVPKRDQSGDTDRNLGISKTGNAYVRKLLVQCAQHMLGPHGADSDLRRFGLKLASRGGKAAKKKAIVAVARKLAVLLLALWKSGESYEPLRNSKEESGNEIETKTEEQPVID